MPVSGSGELSRDSSSMPSSWQLPSRHGWHSSDWLAQQLWAVSAASSPEGERSAGRVGRRAGGQRQRGGQGYDRCPQGWFGEVQDERAMNGPVAAYKQLPCQVNFTRKAAPAAAPAPLGCLAPSPMVSKRSPPRSAKQAKKRASHSKRGASGFQCASSHLQHEERHARRSGTTLADRDVG